MPWDCQCPNCSSMVTGSMSDDEYTMTREMNVLMGLHIVCPYCKVVFDCDEHEVVGRVVYDVS